MQLSKLEIETIAQQYLDTPHRPYHPSWGTLMLETIEQFHALRDQGWVYRSINVPYHTSEEMFQACRAKELVVFTGGSHMGAYHPLANSVPLKDWGSPDNESWTVNQMFRAVHDVNGHFTARCGFESLDGELGAYVNHKKLYSPAAIPALFAETVGQVCHYYSGRGYVAVQMAKVMNEVRL